MKQSIRIKESELHNLIKEAVHETVYNFISNNILNEVKRPNTISREDLIKEKENIKELISRFRVFGNQLFHSDGYEWSVVPDRGISRTDNLKYILRCYVSFDIPNARTVASAESISRKRPLLVPVYLHIQPWDKRFYHCKEFGNKYCIDKIDLRTFDFSLDNFIRKTTSTIDYIIPEFINRHFSDTYKNEIMMFKNIEVKNNRRYK